MIPEARRVALGDCPVAGNGRVRVVFRLRRVDSANRISVLGEFNDWHSTATPVIRRSPEADWTATLELEAGLPYRFRYLLDGKKWLNDWYADDYEDNACGTSDSVVDLREFGGPAPC